MTKKTAKKDIAKKTAARKKSRSSRQDGGTHAREIMSTEVTTVTDETTVEEALRILVNNRITGIPVINSKGKMVGVLSEYDLLIQISQGADLGVKVFQQKITFSKKIASITDDTPLGKIVPMFIESKFRRLPVVNHSGKLVGIITRRDLMRLYYYRAKLN